MARRRIDPAKRSARAQNKKWLQKANSNAQRAQSVSTGQTKKGMVAGAIEGMGAKRATIVTSRGKRTSVPSNTVRFAAPRSIGMRVSRAEDVAHRSGMRRAGISLGKGGVGKTPTRSRVRRSVFTGSKGRSGSGARRVFKRDVRGRFA